LSIRVQNDGTTGTTLSQLAKANSSGAAINAGTSDTGIPVFIVIGGAGTTGNAQLAIAGAVSCKFDASGGTAGHFVQASTSTAGTCHDAGASVPTSGWIVGTLLSSPAANANGTVLLIQGFLPSTGGGSFTGGTLTSELTLAAATTGAASENIPSGTAPTTPVAGDIWRDTNGFNVVESTATNGSFDVRSDQAGAVGPANTVRYTADSNVAKVSENGGALQEIMQLTKTQSPTNKAFDTTSTGMWQFLGKSSLGANAATVGPLVLTATRKHMQIRLWVPGYANSGIVSLQLGGASIDTGSNYACSLLEGATLTTTSVNVTGMRMGVTTTTSPRYVVIDVDNFSNSQVKRILFRSNSISTSAGTAPTMVSGACIWADTTNSIQRIQFTAFNATTGTTTVNLNSGTEFEVWGRDDN
jgi:hypothetical protein